MRDFNHLGKWLPEKLAQAGVSAETLANAVGVNRASVYFWMSDKTRPTEQSMVKVCRVLRVPLKEGLSQYTPKKNGRPGGPTTRSTAS